MKEASPSEYTLKDITSQLELKNLVFGVNNFSAIQEVADSLQLDVGLVNVIYDLLSIDSILVRDGVVSNLPALSKKLIRITSADKLFVYGAPKTSSKSNGSVDNIELEVDKLIEIITERIVTIKGKKGGLKVLLEDRFHPQTSIDRVAVINRVLLKTYRSEMIQYISTSRSENRIIILEKLLKDNPE
jgi:hypothetical protein